MAITVDADVHRLVLQAAEAKGMSVSAWMTEAARRTLKIEDGLRAVEEFQAIHGAFTEEELAESRRRVAAAIANAPAPTPEARLR